VTLTLQDVMHDLEADSSLRPQRADRLLTLDSLRRPALGGPAFVLTYLTARALGRVHPRLARGALLRLWVTPWVHPSTLRSVNDVPGDLAPWSLPAEGRILSGFTGGAGRTVVLVHGWAGRAADWRHLAHDLVAAGWRVVAPDLPAHGKTAGRGTNPFELGRALATVLRHERPAVVITHSLGFPTTMRALEEGADVPDTLIALAPGRKMVHALEHFGAKAGLRPALVEEIRRAMQDRVGHDIWEVLDVDRVVVGLRCRGLVIHDADDDEVSMADAQHIASHWPGAGFVATEGLGHRRILRSEFVRELVVDAIR
jgi:pimeloyl-ACP methyl ester carboxylesterase